MAVFYTGTTITGISADDYIFGEQTAGGPAHTLNGGDGNDFIVGDIRSFLLGAAGNNDQASAVNLENTSWTTYLSDMFESGGVPHLTAFGSGQNQEEWYSVAIGAGETITIDIDGGNFRSVITLRDSAGTQIAYNNGGTSILDGGAGSMSSDDAFLQHTVGAAGTYYIQIEEFGTVADNVVDFGDYFVMNVSVTGHTANAAPTTDSDDVLNGGNGNDMLIGEGGNDTLDGGSGNDRVFGGRGNDTLDGGAGSDTIYGGVGDDTIVVSVANSIQGDVYNGGDGADTLDLSAMTAGYTVNLQTGILGLTAGGGAATLSGIEVVIGGSGNDIITRNNLWNNGLQLLGGDGNDTIYVNSGGVFTNDVYDGGAGTGDTLNVSLATSYRYEIDLTAGTIRENEGFFTRVATGFEIVIGGSNNDTITGDGAANTLAGGGGDDTINGGAGMDTIYTGDGADTVNGGDGNDIVIGAAGVDAINGDAGDDILNGGDGDDIINGGDGNDTIAGQNQNDTITGGLGNDTLSGGAGDDTISGNLGDDSIYGGSGADQLYGQEGMDTIIAGAGDDNIFGGSDNDTIYTGSGVNTANSGDGDDIMVGGSEVDTLIGASGDDVIYAQGGNDIVYGGTGNDALFGNGGDDELIGNDGADILSGADGNDLLTGGAGNDLFYGGAGNDTITGNDGDDVMFGGSGNDTLNGGAGNDRMYGQANTNVFYGGAGDDNYYGGSGDDTFVFEATDGASIERVSFFNLVDTIQLYGFGFADAAASSASFAQSGANVTFNGSGVLILFYNANVGQVRSRVQVDGLAESPVPGKDNVIADDSKLVIFEGVDATSQDLIAEVFEDVHTHSGTEMFVNDFGALEIGDANSRDFDYDWDLGVFA